MMNINLFIKQFFIENEYQKLANRVVVLRGDGIDLYSNIEDKFETSSICALVAGLWQAAKSLSSFISTNNDFFEFRLGFDTSSSGLYVLPFNFRENEYYICAIYKESDNPALLKRHLRLLKQNLETFLSAIEFEPKVNKSTSIQREGYLFNNITDEEMDKLFSSSRM